MPEQRRSRTGGFVTSCGIGVLGGLIGLGGAEFRLPLLMFGFPALEVLIVNKAVIAWWWSRPLMLPFVPSLRPPRS